MSSTKSGQQGRTAEPQSPAAGGAAAADAGVYLRRHLRFGWWTLLVYLTLGIVLEGLHGFKAGYYLDVSNASRRLMWTLAHAHGTLLALVNLAFAWTVSRLPAWDPLARRFASLLLVAATLLLPAGFFLGGVTVYGGDPGLGVAAVALGGLLLLAAVLLIARGTATLALPDGATQQPGERARRGK